MLRCTRSREEKVPLRWKKQRSCTPIKFDPNDVAASIATFAAILPIPNVTVPTAPSTNPDAKAPTYCFALPSFPIITKFVIPVAATLNTPPTTPPNKICTKCIIG